MVWAPLWKSWGFLWNLFSAKPFDHLSVIMKCFCQVNSLHSSCYEDFFVGFYFSLLILEKILKETPSSYAVPRILNASCLLDCFLNVSIQWILMNFDHQIYFLNERLDKSSIGKHANIFSETAICMQNILMQTKLN